jgi:hypothetical protein
MKIHPSVAAIQATLAAKRAGLGMSPPPRAMASRQPQLMQAAASGSNFRNEVSSASGVRVS